MASKLCCTAEEEARPDSPELPNVRVNKATPAKRPLLSKQNGSQSSRFTSARTEDLNELHLIFGNAKDTDDDRSSPTKMHSRFARPSVYSLRSLHKMKSMHSLIRRKFSRDLTKKPSATQVKHSGAKTSAPSTADPDTVLRQPKDGPNLQVKLTKEDIRRDLLSDKQPAEGGYDPDAEMLDDVGRNIGKRTPSKRLSVHSIEWTSSNTSKSTPGSSSKSDPSADPSRDLQPYQIKQPRSAPSARFNQVSSTPNLQHETSKRKEGKLRRSHSATSFELPAPSPISPLRLPSLKTHDHEGVSWSAALNESLRRSQFPIPPRTSTPKRPCSSLEVLAGSRESDDMPQDEESQLRTHQICEKVKGPQSPAAVVQIRVQEPTSAATPRPSPSVRGTVREDDPPPTQESPKGHEEASEFDNPRQSIHLYSMRISHHLRSGSLLSWDNLIDAPELPNPPRAFRERSLSDLSRASQNQRQLTRQDRRTSSSGFASSRVPSKWGRVVPRDLREDKSSIYSSRPHSPPDSLGASMLCLSETGTKPDSSHIHDCEDANPRKSNSYPTDDEETPRPMQRHGLTNLHDVSTNRRSTDSTHRARNNSVASTKKSKFREEFSPSPPKKRLTPPVSIMKFLNQKRSTIRSRSEANLQKPSIPEIAVDESLDAARATTQREHRLSKSTMSLDAEQDALGKDIEFNPVWDRALKNYQDERAAMFLPKNKKLAHHASPFRERSASVSQRRPTMDEGTSPRKLSVVAGVSVPSLEHSAPDQTSPQAHPGTRRPALAGGAMEDFSPDQEVQMAFNQQTNTADTVGAWGRYPSHTRPERALSAGHLDSIDTRDFALEAAIKFAMGKNGEAEEDYVDPTSRPESPPLAPGQKKRKKKVGHTAMAKSHSMTFGKTLLKNYTKIFKSQSAEFQRHGYGHRSSIAPRGTLEYPELEILPDVWGQDTVDERSRERSLDNSRKRGTQMEYGSGDCKGKGKLKEEDSAATLRPVHWTKPTGDAVAHNLDGQGERRPTRDTARVWSAYYEHYLPSYPRASTEMEFDLEDSGTRARHSLESKRPSMHSRTMPVRLMKHSRNASRVSCLSTASHNSMRPSFVAAGDNGEGGEGRSVVSVRQSTMDLVTLYKEQENTERERVLGLMRMQSTSGNKAVAAL